MGIFSRTTSLTQAAQALQPGRTAIASPWASGASLQLIASDVFGSAGELLPVTRAEAMRVPGVVAARNIVCGSLAQGVLGAWKGSEKITDPAWLYRTDSDVPPAIRLLWTFDDLFFGGYALWEVLRGAAGQIVDAVRVPPERWAIDDDMRVRIDEQPVDAAAVILFTGLDDGLLNTGASYIRGARELHRTVRSRVKVPVPHTVLRGTDPTMELDDDEVDKLLKSWVAARQSVETGAVSYIPPGIEVDKIDGTDVQLYEQGRNAEVLDLARLTGVPAAMLEASQVAASLTYETREGARAILADRLRARAQVVEARLSMDDVTPRGTRIALDLSAVIPDTPLPAPTED